MKKESKRKKQATHQAQWDGLLGIEKRVGSWGKKVKAKVKVKKERVDMGKSGREKTEGEEL